MGHFPNTKHHIRLQMYRDEQKVSSNYLTATMSGLKINVL